MTNGFSVPLFSHSPPPPFFSHFESCSCIFHLYLLMIPHFPPFSSISLHTLLCKIGIIDLCLTAKFESSVVLWVVFMRQSCDLRFHSKG